MDITTRRVLLAGLGLGPALLLPNLAAGAQALTVGLLASAAASAGIAVSSVRIRRRAATSTEGDRDTLLRVRVLRSPPADIPDHGTRIDRLNRVLGRGCPVDGTASETPDTVVARTLRRAMERHAAATPRHLSERESLALYLLVSLLRAPPCEAGRLSQLFRHPDRMLGLRDMVDTLSRRRALLDRAPTPVPATDPPRARQRDGDSPPA